MLVRLRFLAGSAEVYLRKTTDWGDLPLSELRPTGLALILCDNIYVDRRGKRALVGIFNQISASQFPVIHNQMVAYAAVTAIRDGAVLKLEIAGAETERVIFAGELPPAEQADPTAILELSFDIENLGFPEPGRYYVTLWGNNYPLLQRPIQVILNHELPAEEECDGNDPKDDTDNDQ